MKTKIHFMNMTALLNIKKRRKVIEKAPENNQIGKC